MKTTYVSVVRGVDDDYPRLVSIRHNFETAAKDCGTFHSEALLDSGEMTDADDAFDAGGEVVEALMQKAESPRPQDDIHHEAEFGDGQLIYSIMFQNN